jgi:hypothetical protein
MYPKHFMLNILHITNHVGTSSNIANMCKLLKHPLTTLSWRYHYYINEADADIIFDEYKNLIKTFTHIIFTDTSMIARPFLQNIQKHTCRLIVYVTNRFNWGIWGFEDIQFNELYCRTSRHERVLFTSDNKYDMYYAQRHNVFFNSDNILRLTPYIEPKDIISLPTNNRFFIYNRGTKLEAYKESLDGLQIDYDVFGEGFSRFRDQKHICEYIGIIHLPYQTNIQSLYENLAYNIIYFLPSYRFISELVKTGWYYWEEKHRPSDMLEESIKLSEWYVIENQYLFVYFDNWEDLKTQITNVDIINKKTQIQKHMRENQETNLQIWQKYLK